MNNEMMLQVLNKIKEYERIMLFRHIRNDGDCVGASKGFKRILQLSFPEKEIYLIDPDTAEYLEFMGPEDPEVADEIYADALAIVLDTATEERISNKKYALCREILKIDHHIPLDNYGQLNWVEQKCSSCSEMIVAFYNQFKNELKIDSKAATYLYTGIVTDTGRFRYSGVNGDTLRNAATLLDIGVDTDILFARLYLESFDHLKFKSQIYNRMQITENGVAYLYIDKAMQEEFNLSYEQAGACVENMESIRGCISWIVFIEVGDEKGTVRVRMRSRFVHINGIAEKYRGGGHGCASGATVYSREEALSLLADTDAHVKEYKENNEGWL